MNMFDLIRAWADSKRLTKEETVEHRFAIAMMTTDELMLGFVQHDREQALKGVGNLVIDLTLLMAHYGLPIETAVQEAWAKRDKDKL